jgi:4-amino-4-deoxy-L-arabinose transferase-like glycosyltransferase
MEAFFTRLAARPQRSILILSLLLLLAGNWILPLTDRDEARFGEASREMLQRGDYVVPWFNGQYRFDKPVLIYWCQMASYRVFGVNDFAARLPSVLFTTATALLLVRWGRKLKDNLTGFLAGGMYVTALHVAVIGRIATADMAMVFFTTAAVWSGWELTRPEQPRRWPYWWIFYVALGLGFLAKGPVAWLPLAGILLGCALHKNGYRLSWFATLAGLVVTILLVAAWGLPALVRTHGQFWRVGMGEHVFNRSFGVIDSHGLAGWAGFVAALPLYFLTFFVSFLPWSTKVPGRLRSWWRGRATDEIGGYLLLQAAVVFVVFSLVRTKLPHYTMPAFPCIALWLALQISGEPRIAAWAGRRMTVMTGVILVITLGVFSFAKPHLLTENLWQKLRPHLQPDTKVGCFGYTEASQVWRFRNVITNDVILGDVKEAANFLTNQPPFVLVVPTGDLAKLPDTNGLLLEVRGLDMVKFKNRDLTAIVRE